MLLKNVLLLMELKLKGFTRFILKFLIMKEDIFLKVIEKMIFERKQGSFEINPDEFPMSVVKSLLYKWIFRQNNNMVLCFYRQLVLVMHIVL